MKAPLAWPALAAQGGHHRLLHVRRPIHTPPRWSRSSGDSQASKGCLYIKKLADINLTVFGN